MNAPVCLEDNEIMLEEEEKKIPELSRNSEFQKTRCLRKELYECTCI